ncbi:Atg7p [Lachancea thermotolerans CBS 6340]|uniref:Ubiquitin-like modifier-activating enzyme ATG7 n=1 Tax=Lachancea thermotolerans (strain ATCC 56472 / CBS 6340 / NRRL Y-8284) TaxID=559295 RepID=C5E1Y1_LACTC|nr:KLTH0H00572p [Lachancea thermotolerans CBS 6340]CAR30042.1 KLTH0H00572p [Lachancea thermotolerans CBS 6340]
MSDPHLKFVAPCQSFLDTSFFQELARLKLDVLKLDSAIKELTSSIGISHIPRGSPCAHLFLDSHSFGSRERKEGEMLIKGSLYNFNTIEEFKKVDKTRFLRDRADELWKEGIEDPNDCVKFSIISFADLKAFKFFYWVCVPCFQLDSLTASVRGSGPFKSTSKFDEWFAAHPGCWSCLVGESGELMEFNKVNSVRSSTLCMRDTSTVDMVPSALAKSFISLLKHFRSDLKEVRLIFIRSETASSFWVDTDMSSILAPDNTKLKVTGWERNLQNKLTPRAVDLSSLIDPLHVADQSLDLNLKLMKWRIAPEINLDIIKNTSVLLLGSGTLGCYVARVLLAWGVRKITFVDNGTVSFSNPVRQPLFTFNSCGKPKAAAAADSLREIFPLVEAEGVELAVPMIGHPITSESKQNEDYKRLLELIKAHDVVFLLMDSRETRWLPTVMGYAEDKIVINAALGFDSYLVMRHGNYETDQKADRLGCYFCQDVVAPSDSLTDRTLDQMCTVTRPGVALMAASQSVELLVSLLQHPMRNGGRPDEKVILGDLPHQIRGFLSEFKTLQLRVTAYEHCSACSSIIVEEFKSRGWDFVRDALNDYKTVEDLCGLSEVQLKAEEVMNDVLDEWDDDGEDGELL